MYKEKQDVAMKDSMIGTLAITMLGAMGKVVMVIICYCEVAYFLTLFQHCS
jgi:hypothetical protein